MILAASSLVLFVLLLLIGHWQKIQWLIVSSKAAASAHLIGLAIYLSYFNFSHYSALITIGISLGFIGDLAMLRSSKRWFVFAMMSFGIGHIAYILAITLLQPNLMQASITLLIVLVSFSRMFQWLSETMPSELRLGVIIYSVLLLSVFALALATRVNGYPAMVALAATLFMLSDFFVATYRFKKPRLTDKLIGLPLYYAAQICYIYSITEQDLSWAMF